MVSQDGINALVDMRNARGGSYGEFPEFDCGGHVIKELENNGFIVYDRGSVRITPEGEAFLKNYRK